MDELAIFFYKYHNTHYVSDDSNDNSSFEEENKSKKSNEIEIFENKPQIRENSRISEDNNENHSDSKTRPKSFKSLEKNKNVFNIKKYNKKNKIGRKKSGEKTSEIKHGKTASDNIKAKIIRRFINNKKIYSKQYELS